MKGFLKRYMESNLPNQCAEEMTVSEEATSQQIEQREKRPDELSEESKRGNSSFHPRINGEPLHSDIDVSEPIDLRKKPKERECDCLKDQRDKMTLSRNASNENEASGSSINTIAGPSSTEMSLSEGRISEKEFDSDIDDAKPIDLRKKPLQCSTCMKVFCTKSKLTKHEREHSREASYRCEICLKGFKHKFLLLRHRLVHTGERPFPCRMCKKKFTCKHHLTQHENDVHTRLKQFQCKMCSHKSSHKGNLQKHLRVVHKIPVSALREMCEKYISKL